MSYRPAYTHTHTKRKYSTVDAHTSCQPVTAEGSPPIHQLRGLIGCFKPCTVFLVRSLRKRRKIKKIIILDVEVTQFRMKIKTSQMLWDVTRGSQVRARPVRTGPVDACGKQATRRANTNIHALHFPSFLCLSLCPLCCSFLPFLMAPPPRAPGASKGASQLVEKKRACAQTKITRTLRSNGPRPPAPPPAGALPALRQEDKWAEIRPPGPMCVVIQKGRRAVAGRSRPTAVWDSEWTTPVVAGLRY